MIQKSILHSEKEFYLILLVSLLFYSLMALVMQWVNVPPPSAKTIRSLPPRIAKLILEPPRVPSTTVARQRAAEPMPPMKSASSALGGGEKRRAPPKDQDITMRSGLLRLLTREDTILRHSTFEGLLPDPGVRLSRQPPSAGTRRKGEASGGVGIGQVLADLDRIGEIPLEERKSSILESPFTVRAREGGAPMRDYDSIARVVASHSGAIQEIYNKALRENPTLRGTVTVEFVITSSGEVISCRVVNSSLRHPPLEEALVKRILAWRFPEIPQGKVIVTYPLNFSPA